MKTKYTKELLEPLVKESFTVSDVVRKLNLKTKGGNHYHISRMIKYHNIDTSHFLGQGWSIGKELSIHKTPIEEYLSNKSYISSHRLKNKLFKEKIFEKKCYKCNLTEWFNEPISLELHHLDENRMNNSLDNLTILCPNCHAYLHKSRR